MTIQSPATSGTGPAASILSRLMRNPTNETMRIVVERELFAVWKKLVGTDSRKNHRKEHWSNLMLSMPIDANQCFVHGEATEAPRGGLG